MPLQGQAGVTLLSDNSYQNLQFTHSVFTKWILKLQYIHRQLSLEKILLAGWICTIEVENAAFFHMHIAEVTHAGFAEFVLTWKPYKILSWQAHNQYENISTPTLSWMLGHTSLQKQRYPISPSIFLSLLNSFSRTCAGWLSGYHHIKTTQPESFKSCLQTLTFSQHPRQSHLLSLMFSRNNNINHRWLCSLTCMSLRIWVWVTISEK